MRRNMLSVIAMTALLGAVTAGSALGHPVVGQPAPALVVAKLDGSPFDLAAQRGKVVVINYWATWCPPCREEMPGLDAFYKAHRGVGFELLGVSVDRARDRKAVAKVMETFTYPAALMADAKHNDFGAPRILPVTYVIDAQGIVRAILYGSDDKPLDPQQLAAAVLPLLGQPAQAGAKP